MRRIALLLALATGALAGCTDEDRTVETLHKAGFKNVQTGGYDYFACGEHDNFSTHFTATNPAGERVEGTVCCGIMKNCTIRF